MYQLRLSEAMILPAILEQRLRYGHQRPPLKYAAVTRNGLCSHLWCYTDSMLSSPSGCTLQSSLHKLVCTSQCADWFIPSKCYVRAWTTTHPASSSVWPFWGASLMRLHMHTQVELLVQPVAAWKVAPPRRTQKLAAAHCQCAVRCHAPTHMCARIGFKTIHG